MGACVLPFVREKLQEKLGQEVEITWIVDNVFAEVLQDSPCVDRLFVIPLKKGGIRAIPKIINRLKALSYYDKVIDMQGLIKSAVCGDSLKVVSCGDLIKILSKRGRQACFTRKK